MSYKEAILVHALEQALDEEMVAFVSRGTWELVSAPKMLWVVVGSIL